MSRFTRYIRTIDCPADDCEGRVTIECTREPETRHEPAIESSAIVLSTCDHQSVGDVPEPHLMDIFWDDLAAEADAGDPMAP